MTKTIHILCNTYNRGTMLQSLMNDIDEQKDGFRVTATILQDGGFNYIQYIQFSQPIHLIHNEINKGKKGYWRTCNELFQAVSSRNPSDIYIMLPDDAKLKPGALKEIVRLWEQIEKKAICLNLRLDRSRIGKSNWQSGLPTIERHGTDNYFKTGWVDMAFICGPEFFKALNWRIKSIHSRKWRGHPELGSGVGQQITERLKDRRKKMYQVRYPVLINEGGGASQMNPMHNEVEKEEYRLDPIIAGMATMPGREKFVRKAIDSIHKQVDTLYVTINEAPRFKEKLEKYYTGTNVCIVNSFENGGDAAKFNGYITSKKHPHYYFTFDDDLHYPADHVWRLFHQIERLERKWIVGTHGRRIPDHKVGSYYGIGAGFHWRKAITKDAIKVNCIGTGTCGFHSSTIDLSMDDFPLTHKNMADIHLGVAAQKQNVPMCVVRHPADYFIPLGVPPEETIYHKHKNDDRLQTDLVNSIKWRLI